MRVSSVAAACQAPSSSDGSMKLLTHNMLSCHIKGVKNGYPFIIEATKVVEHEADFDPGTSGHRQRG